MAEQPQAPVGPQPQRTQPAGRQQSVKKSRTGAYVDQTRLTVAEYLKHWLSSYAKPTVSESTYERYEGIVLNHLIPGLGLHRLGKLRPLHIQAYYAEAEKSGRVQRPRKPKPKPKRLTKRTVKKDEKPDTRLRGLSAQTVKHHHRVLHEALKQAVRWGLLAVNPADAVQPPKPQPHEIHVLDAGGSVNLLESLRGTRFHLPCAIALGTGMRLGEVLALRWQDVDLEAGRISVRQSLQQTKGGLVFKTPKTARGQRSITLDAETVVVLEAQKQAQKDAGLISPLVVCEADGSPYYPDRFSAEWRKRVTRSWGVRFHDLRHTHATLLLAKNTNAKVVSERLGHSTIGITLDTYSHVLPSMQDEAARNLGELFADARAAAGIQSP